MAGVKFMVGNEEMHLVKGEIEGSWWTIRDSQRGVQGIVVVYVDDVLVCSTLPVLRATSSAIGGLWKTTDLAIITPGFPQRFLGMEVEMDSSGDFWVSQHGYIKEILRSRGISAARKDKVPLSKDQAFFEVLPTDLPADEALIKEAQSLTEKFYG